MKTNIFILAIFLFVSQVAYSQLFSTQSGITSFFSKTPLEDITAVNSNVSAILNTSTGEIAVRMNMNQFNFPNKLMQEHFNENYIESDEFPTGTFTGKINEEIDFKKTGIFEVSAKGILTLHGVSKEKVIKGKLNISKTGISLDSDFEVMLVDYKIDVPKIVWEKIAEKISVRNSFSLMKK
ncbi:YceI family protein [Arcicella rigui]|uniref:YceI family protein n=1 Tax=Arcicella rigui TaxID=797020 RepID=A0ABU5Q7C7_9BACT|nr:YceI family protein [Arcicella rigui]MEA5138753.1 YceI family protein [Arcicella rigui]